MILPDFYKFDKPLREYFALTYVRAYAENITTNPYEITRTPAYGYLDSGAASVLC
jgi:hypothetical protein